MAPSAGGLNLIAAISLGQRGLTLSRQGNSQAQESRHQANERCLGHGAPLHVEFYLNRIRAAMPVSLR
jgi:hypothetical protein